MNTNGKRAVGEAELLEREWETADRWRGSGLSASGGCSESSRTSPRSAR